MKAGTILKQGEAESRNTGVTDDITSVHHVTKHKTGDIVCDWKFDFADVSREQLIRLATRSLVIDARNAFKKLKVVGEAHTHTYEVAEMIKTQKRGKSNSEKVQALLANMSPEEVANAMAVFQK